MFSLDYIFFSVKMLSVIAMLFVSVSVNYCFRIL